MCDRCASFLPAEAVARIFGTVLECRAGSTAQGWAQQNVFAA